MEKLTTDSKNDLVQRYDDLCRDINLDVATKREAFQAFESILENYTVEGDPLHWLACSVYSSCRRKVVSTVDKRETKGNYISLTRLLRSAKLSLIQFFNKVKKWADMDRLPKEFSDRVNQVERGFDVTTVIYRKYEPMFWTLFKHTGEELPVKQARGRKQRPKPCGVGELYCFTWKMFIQSKGCFPAIGGDLVNSYHLLLCVVDWVYGNAVCSRKDQLLNTEFEGFPESLSGAAVKLELEPPCVLEILCRQHNGLVVEAMTLKEHYWKAHVKKLMEAGILVSGSADPLCGALDVNWFHANTKAVDKAYEEHVLAVGDFDERVFLGKLASEEIGTPVKQPSNSVTTGQSDFAARLHSTPRPSNSDLRDHLQKAMTFAPATPLTTNRRYLPVQQMNVTPVKTATEEARRLNTVLHNCRRGPSDNLLQLYSTCTSADTIQESVHEVIDALGAKFLSQAGEEDAALTSNPTSTLTHAEVAKKRLALGEMLFYKLLETIVVNEIKLVKQNLPTVGSVQINVNITALLEKDIFLQSLFAVGMEIVLFSYNCKRTFPWIVKALDLDPFHIYQVIELVIKAEEKFSRDLVKHLNFMEESILESQAWDCKSYVWTLLKEHKTAPPSSRISTSFGPKPNNSIPTSDPPVANGVPSCQAVALPPTASRTWGGSLTEGGILGATPTAGGMAVSLVSPPVLGYSAGRRVPASDSKLITLGTVSGRNTFLSPHVATADRFSSPLPAGTAKRRLFGGIDSGPPKKVVLQPASMKGGRQIYIPVQLVPSTSRMGHAGGATITLTPTTPEGSIPSGLSTPGQAITVTAAASATLSATGVEASPAAGVAAPLASSYTKTTTTGASATTLLLQAASSPMAAAATAKQTIGSSTEAAAFSISKSAPPVARARRKRTSALFLFFRKVYYLASIRLKNLCEHLFIDRRTHSKIWTILEYCLMHHTSIMIDRHIDQIILCTVYAVLKDSVKTPVTFPDVIKYYRLQPQSQSHVYRSVLLFPNKGASSKKTAGDTDTKPCASKTTDVGKDNPAQTSAASTGRTNSAPPTPSKEDSPQSPAPRKDLVDFYNLVYLRYMDPFISRFSAESTDMPPLSPLPTLRTHTGLSPRKVSSNHSLFVSPHKTVLTPGRSFRDTHKCLQYTFEKSPAGAKDLKAINKMVNGQQPGQLRLQPQASRSTPLQQQQVLGGASFTVVSADIESLPPGSKRALLAVQSEEVGGLGVEGSPYNRVGRQHASPLVDKLEIFRQEADKSQ